MGDYLSQTFRKCVLGVTEAVLQGRPIGPSTEENCAVALRELKEHIRELQPIKVEPKDLAKLMPKPTPRNHILSKQKAAPPARLENGKSGEENERLLKALSPEQRQRLLKELGNAHP